MLFDRKEENLFSDLDELKRNAGNIIWIRDVLLVNICFLIHKLSHSFLFLK